MPPFDACTQSFDNTVKLQSHGHGGDPLMDFIRDQIHDATHDYMKQAVSQKFVDTLVKNNLIDSTTGKAILPLCELVYDKLDPCQR